MKFAAGETVHYAGPEVVEVGSVCLPFPNGPVLVVKGNQTEPDVHVQASTGYIFVAEPRHLYRVDHQSNPGFTVRHDDPAPRLTVSSVAEFERLFGPRQELDPLDGIVHAAPKPSRRQHLADRVRAFADWIDR